MKRASTSIDVLTITEQPMRRTLLQSLLPAAVAVMMSLGIVMTAAAETDSATPSALVPGATVLDRLVEIGVLPAEARDALVRVRLEHTEHVAPGALCRRVANAENPPASLVERCREANQDDESLSPGAACRRVAAATDPADSLVERCRTWLSAEGEPPAGRFAVCRRIANAESVDADPIERCRAILAAAPGRSSDAARQVERPEAG